MKIAVRMVIATMNTSTGLFNAITGFGGHGLLRHGCDNELEPGPGEQRAECRSPGGEQETLHQELLNQPQAAGAKDGADSELLSRTMPARA